MLTQGHTELQERGFLTRGERHFRGLSLDATMLTDPNPQLAVPTAQPGVSLEALAVAFGACGALAVWAGG